MDTIILKTYQSLEAAHINHKEFNFNEYSYIVCDEFQYFLSDAAFNITTDISLNQILEATNAVRIFMSATGDDMKRYLNNIKKIITTNFEIPINYNFIKSLDFFNKDETMDKFIQEAIEKNEKGIFFIQSAKKAYELYKKYSKDCLFNCSKYNSNYYKYVDKEKISNMLKNEKFDELILITTTCMDAGVNIQDAYVKHIVCDVEDTGTLIQCIGRKRLKNDADKIYLYVHTISNKSLGGKKSKILGKIEMANYLKNHTVKEFIHEFPRQNDYANIIYDSEVNEDNKGTKKINELRYFKLNLDIVEIEYMLSYKEFGYCKYIANKFRFKDKDTGQFSYGIIDEEYLQDNLQKYLESIIGKKLYKDEQQELKDVFNKAGLKAKRTLGINTLNGYLLDLKLPYTIKSKTTHELVDNKRKTKRCWIIYKLIDKVA